MDEKQKEIFSALFKNPNLFSIILVILGVYVGLIAAFGDMPYNPRPLPTMPSTIRYTLGGVGFIIFIAGIVLYFWQSRARTLGDKRTSRELELPLVEQFRKSGLTYAFRIPADDPARQERVRQLVEQEAKTDKLFRLAASSGRSYLNHNGWVWVAGLGELIVNRTVKMEAVLASPFSQFAITRALANKSYHHHWEKKLRIEDIVSLLQYPNVSIRVTDEPINCSLFFTSQAVYYDPYLWGRLDPGATSENRFWVFEFDKIESKYECYRLLEKHFEFLWRYSVPLEEVLHAPAEGSELPRGKDFYYFHTQYPDLALNRYNELTREFCQNTRSRRKGR